MNFNLGRGDLDIDENWSQGGLAELKRMVYRVCIQNHQLQATGQLKDPLNLALDLSYRHTEMLLAIMLKLD